MKTKFVKHTMHRDSRFQIITVIEQDDQGQLCVKKKARTPVAVSHIETIYKNCQKLSVIGECLKVPEFTLIDDTFISSYISGETLEQRLSVAVQSGRREDLISAFVEYLELLHSLPSIELDPSTNEGFCEIFSHGDTVFRCIKLGLIDLIPENIICDEYGNYYHIDCEWLIEAPVPVAFVLFRAIVVFYNKFHVKLATILSLQELVERFGLSDHVQLFNQWEQEFSNHIHGDYQDYKNNYLVDVPYIENWMDKKPESAQSSLFYSIDSKFSEEKKVTREITIKNDYIEIEYLFTDTVQANSFRWDPCEGFGTVISNLIIKSYTIDGQCIDCNMSSSNGNYIGAEYIFLSADPQIVFLFAEPKMINMIKICANISFYSYRDLVIAGENLNKYYESIITNKDDQIANDEQQIQHSIEIDNQYEKQLLYKQKVIDNLQHEYSKNFQYNNLIMHSIPYRIFQPVRRVKRIIIDFIKPLQNFERARLTTMDDSVTQEAPGVFLCNSDDPKIIINQFFKAGLYLLKWDGEASRRALLKIYPITDGRTNEFSSVRLGYLETTNMIKERFIYLKTNAELLRLDLGDTPKNLTVLKDLFFKRIHFISAIRIGLTLINKRTGFGKTGLLLHFSKRVLAGKSHEVRQHFVEAFNNFGDGKTVYESDEAAYKNYMLNCEPTQKSLDIQKTKSDEFAYKPLISIIVPTYNTDSTMLTEMIESVRAQTYANWQLCLADGNSQKPEVLNILKEYERSDTRIICQYLNENLGIVGNSNKALDLATGEYIALLDHDDLLAPWALYEIAQALNKNPDIDMLYSDEDKITADSSMRHQPHFKPDWSPDLLRSYNYITHLFVARATLVNEVGRFRTGYDGSQDHDLILRVSEKSNRIHHITSILYHWRSHEASTALNPQSKTYTLAAGIKAINDHLNRIGLVGKTSYDEKIGIYYVDYELVSQPLISIIIPNYEHKDILERCINSIREKTSYSNYEIIIIENNSKSQEIFDYYKQLQFDSRIKVVYWPDTFNYSAINNFGVRNAAGEFLLLLNNDTEVISEDWIEQMLQYAQRDDAGCVGAKLYYTNGLIQHAGVILGFQGIAAHSFCQMPGDYSGYMNRAIVSQNVSAVTAACLMIKKELFQQVNGFDEQLAVAFNDIDFCQKIIALGKRNIFNPRAELYHHESLSRGYEDTEEKQKRFATEINYFKEKWSEVLERGDPYYNPHLDLELQPFRISGE